MIDEGCPVCGRNVVETNRIPENPSPNHGPDSPGWQFVHRLEEVKKGHFEVGGCSMYENGEVDPWEPDEETENVRESDS